VSIRTVGKQRLAPEERFFSPVGEKVRSQKRRKERRGRDRKMGKRLLKNRGNLKKIYNGNGRSF